VYVKKIREMMGYVGNWRAYDLSGLATKRPRVFISLSRRVAFGGIMTWDLKL